MLAPQLEGRLTQPEFTEEQARLSPPHAQESLANVPHPEAEEYVIGPTRGWQLINVRELWRFRELIYFLVWRDVKVRYKQTLLGVAWSVLQPAMMMAVFTLFFSRVAGFKDDAVAYPVFVLCGLLPWTFFSAGLAASGNSVIGSERLLTKVYFPRLALPLAAVGSALFDFLLTVGLLLVVMLLYQCPPGLTVLLLPFMMLPVAFAALGFGTILAALNVAYRDVRYVIPFVVQIWIFATPAVYAPVVATDSQSWLHTLLALNPINALIAGFRSAVLGRPIDWMSFGASCFVVLGVFLCACLYFRRVEDSFADVI